jgi:MoxR-like ATPase
MSENFILKELKESAKDEIVNFSNLLEKYDILNDNERVQFIGRKNELSLMNRSYLNGESMIIIGNYGSGKSTIIKKFCDDIIIANDAIRKSTSKPVQVYSINLDLLIMLSDSYVEKYFDFMSKNIEKSKLGENKIIIVEDVEKILFYDSEGANFLAKRFLSFLLNIQSKKEKGALKSCSIILSLDRYYDLKYKQSFRMFIPHFREVLLKDESLEITSKLIHNNLWHYGIHLQKYINYTYGDNYEYDVKGTITISQDVLENLITKCDRSIKNIALPGKVVHVFKRIIFERYLQINKQLYFTNDDNLIYNPYVYPRYSTESIKETSNENVFGEKKSRKPKEIKQKSKKTTSTRSRRTTNPSDPMIKEETVDLSIPNTLTSTEENPHISMNIGARTRTTIKQIENINIVISYDMVDKFLEKNYPSSDFLTKKIKPDDLISFLKQRIRGQDNAIEMIVPRIIQGIIGINTGSRPIASFIFSGTSGVGKTEVAKLLCKFFFAEDKERLVRLDMSEYKSKEDLTRLIGSAPGLIGSDEGGILTNSVRRHGSCIILFDEIEKAHPDIADILLQILDAATLRDNKGEKVSFDNTIIIITTNIGSGLIKEANNSKKNKSPEDRNQLKLKIIEEMKDKEKGKMREEFINRFDSVIIFDPLTQDLMEDIMKLAGNEIIKNMMQKSNIHIEINGSNFYKNLMDKVSFENGAREVKRRVEESIRDLLFNTKGVDRFFEKKDNELFELSISDGKQNETIAVLNISDKPIVTEAKFSTIYEETSLNTPPRDISENTPTEDTSSENTPPEDTSKSVERSRKRLRTETALNVSGPIIQLFKENKKFHVTAHPFNKNLVAITKNFLFKCSHYYEMDSVIKSISDKTIFKCPSCKVKILNNMSKIEEDLED